MATTRLLRPVWRALSARPGLSVIISGALAVGLAANAVMFAVIDAAVLRPFPFPEPDRLVGVGAAYPRLNRGLSFFEVVSAPEMVDLRRESRTLEDVLGFDLNNEAIVVGEEPFRVFTAFVWSDPFATLRTAPAMGRAFTPAEVESVAPVAVISDALWRSVFQADPAVLGRPFRLNGRVFEIIGVAPPRTRIYGTDLWVPMFDRPDTLPRNRRQFNVLARLAAGATPEMVGQDLEQLARRIELAHGDSLPEYGDFTFGTQPWTEVDSWSLADVSLVAFGATGLVLLLVTANLASLLTARAAGRRREAAVRAALGASRARIATGFAFESFVQAACGAVAGFGLAWLAIRVLPAVAPVGLLPAEVALELNLRVVLGLAIVAAATAAIVGALPALQLARVEPSEMLNEDGRGTVGARSTRRVHAVVVAFEVAAAMIVTGAAALVLVHTGRLLQVDRGFDTSNLATMRITLPVSQYDGERSLVFFDTLLERVRALPAVESASASNQPPPGVFSRSQFEIDGQVAPAGSTLPTTFYTTAASGYRETLGLRLVRGRWFDETSSVSGIREVVVNETLAARYFGDTGAVGRRVRVVGPANDGSWADVVGVVADVRNTGLAADPQPEMMASVRQIPDRRRTQLYVVARYRADDAAVVADVRGLVRALDPVLPIYAISTVDRQFEGGLGSRRAAAWMLALFCVLATGLAGLGIFGVLTHAVSERAREIALRVALGGPRRAIVRLMLAQAMRPVFVGLVIGAIGVTFGERLISSWIFGLRPEPAVTALAGALLLAVGVLAAMWPAVRASRLSPVELLRR